jgi:hypothetical protein
MSSRVFERRQQFQVFHVHARPHPAGVMDVHPLRDRAVRLLPGCAMSEHLLAVDPSLCVSPALEALAHHAVGRHQ